jgi:hypothetical protein
MSFFVVANLGDAALSIPSGSVNSGGTISTGGFVWVNNTSGSAITLTLSSALAPFALFKDVAGNASAHPITITFPGGIHGGTSTQLMLATNGSGWPGMAPVTPRSGDL